jgi:FkbM family methyltransferase
VSLRQRIVRLARRAGYDIVRYNLQAHPKTRFARLLEERGITLVLDIGANIGQFALELRSFGYRGRILSCEPGAEAFAQLQRQTAGDPGWTCRKVALGAREGSASLHLSANSQSSSLLQINARHVEAEPTSRTVAVETVPVTTVDALLAGEQKTGEKVFLKIDTQGFEHEVLAGATASLALLGGVQVEMSLQPLYEGQVLFDDLLALLRKAGFMLVDIEPVFHHPGTGELLQVDGTFFRP